MRIKIYGSRGSIPFFSRSNIQYGGNTPCVRVDTPHGTVILDGGSGLFQLGLELAAERNGNVPACLDILLGHLHLDHILGLSLFEPILNRSMDVRIHTLPRGDSPLVQQVFGPFKPPHWPIDMAEMAEQSGVQILAVSDRVPFALGNGITVTPIKVNHPSNTTAFRIEADKSLVYLLDYEWVDDPHRDELIAFCTGADAIIFDSAFIPEEYARKKGWGHSTYEDGLRLAEASRCGRMIFSHISPDYDDSLLNLLQERIGDGPHRLAYDGMELIL